MSKAQSKETGKVRRDQAFHDFCRMDPNNRSLKLLQQRYIDDPEVTAPSMSSLKRWSSAGGWRQRALEHDEHVARRANEMETEQEAQRLVDCAQGFRHLSEEMLAHLRARLGDINIDKPQDVATLVSAAIESAKTAEVLTGGVSDRTESLGDGQGDGAAGGTSQDSIDALSSALQRITGSTGANGATKH